MTAAKKMPAIKMTTKIKLISVGSLTNDNKCPLVSDPKDGSINA